MSDTDMTAVADAIRTKAGSSESLAFPDGFVTAVEGITTGGAEGEEPVWVQILKDKGNQYNLTNPLAWTGVEITESDWGDIGVVTKIPPFICEWSHISKCTIPETVVEIKDNAFASVYGSKVKDGETTRYHIYPVEFEFPDTEITLNECVFLGTRLRGWPTGLNVTKIPESTFSMLKVVGSDEFIVPEGVQTIISNALTSMEFYLDDLSDSTKVNGRVVLPSTITALDGYGNVIGGAYGTPITLVMKASTPPTTKTSSFINRSYVSSIVVPAGCLEAYQTATNWSVHADIMVEATE